MTLTDKELREIMLKLATNLNLSLLIVENQTKKIEKNKLKKWRVELDGKDISNDFDSD